MPERTSEIERIQRWRRLLRLLADQDPACRTRALLAAELGVGEATLGRDLKDLRALGAEIKANRGKSYRLVGAFDPLVESLSPAQAMALAFLGQSGVNFASTPLAEGAQEVVDAIKRGFAGDRTSDLEWIRRSVRFTDMAKPRIEPAVWEQIAKAFREKRRLRLEYATPREGEQPSPRRFDPWAIIVSSGTWFLHGQQLRGEVAEPRTLHFGRITSAVALPDPADGPPADWNLDDYVAVGFGGLQADGVTPTRYRLRFSPQAASRARERRWPRGATSELQDDGSLIVTFEASLVEWVQREIASWRGEVEVLEPGE